MTINVNRKIKVAQVITRMDWGGPPDILRILCQGLRDDEYEIRLISGETKHPSAKTREFLERFKDSFIPVPRLKRDICIISDLIAFISLWRLFRAGKFDIVHTHTAKAGFLGRIAAKLSAVPRVMHTPHGNNFYGYFGTLGSALVVLLEKIADYFTDRWVVLTELEKNDLLDYKISQAEKITVINSGIELNELTGAGIDALIKRRELGIDTSSDNLVAMIGRLEEVKGPEYFIKAAKIVLEKYTPVKFLLVGEGSLRERLKAQARSLKIEDRVIFCGWRDDVREILPIIDILVLPSLNEAVGRILLEAGCLGVPSVASRTGGVPEIILDGSTGILVRRGDALELAEGIVFLLRNPKKRMEIGLAAKEFIKSKFSAGNMIKQIEELYSQG